MLDLRQVRAFAAVVREGSFTKAAVSLHYAQSSVTAQVQQLESQLGVPLLDRLPGRLEVTTAGEQFLPYAQRLLSLATEACEAVHTGGVPAGTLTLSACESVLTYRLPELLRTFQDRYPKVRVELHAAGICEAGPPLGHEVDIAVSISQPLTDSNLIVERLLVEPICLVVAADHALASRRVVKAVEIVAEQLLLTEENCSYRALFETALSKAAVRPLRTLEFASVEAVKQCAKARMGIAVLPRMVVRDELLQGTLVTLSWPTSSLAVETQLVRRKGKWFSPAMQAFWSTAREVIQELEPARQSSSAGRTSNAHSASRRASDRR